MKNRTMLLGALLTVFAVACGGDKSEQASADKEMTKDEITVSDAELAGNPFREE